MRYLPKKAAPRPVEAIRNLAGARNLSLSRVYDGIELCRSACNKPRVH